MKQGFGIALVVTGCLMAGPVAFAQAQGNGQQPAAAPQQPAAPQQTPQGGGNAFPTDTSNVPVLPSTVTPDVPSGSFGESDVDRMRLPPDDLDPVRSPDTGDAATEISEPTRVSSSDVKGLDSILPKPGEDETGKHKKGDEIEGLPKETAKEDISVGKYYLDIKNWKAAQSRFQSALVLAPEDPEVYWGLAESARHLGDFWEARANYLKVMVYDPGSRHAKDAEKALRDPEIADAKAAAK
ncbi:MAG TPA: hypothetical protein VMV39_05210 [Terracidiphilus sp.]|nr:hypothetical protein [Terracidiphilus sp.]